MKERYNITCPINSKDGKTYWHVIGTAFKNDKMDGFDLIFNSLPISQINDQGKSQCRAMLLKPKDNYEKPASPKSEGFNDEVPF